MEKGEDAWGRCPVVECLRELGAGFHPQNQPQKEASEAGKEGEGEREEGRGRERENII